MPKENGYLTDGIFTEPFPVAPTRHISNENVVQILSFIGGYIDAIGYMRLQTFVSSITGNVIIASISVATKQNVTLRLTVTFMFFVAAFMGAYLVIRMRANGTHACVIALVLLLIEQTLLMIAIVIGMMGGENIHDAPIPLGPENITEAVFSNFLGISMAMAMGFQSICVSSMIRGAPSTTVITSSIVHIAENLAYSLWFHIAASVCTSVPTADNKVKTLVNSASAELWMIKMSVCLKPFLMFVIGALLGGTASYISEYWCLLVPIFLILFIQVEISLQLMHGRSTELSEWKRKIAS
jgi:uncharacterized membrane protein YoaK (UPF0700 family)